MISMSRVISVEGFMINFLVASPMS
jgi:hypothetical protein